MLIWGWNTHHSQKIGNLALDSKYLSYLCLLYGMAEWNKRAPWIQAKNLNYFYGRKGKREEGKIQLSLYFILSAMVFKGWNRCTEPQSCPLFSATMLMSSKSLAQFGFSKKNFNHLNKIFPFPARNATLSNWRQHLKVGSNSLQAAFGSSLATCIFLTFSGLSLESCRNASFLSIFLCSKPIPKMKQGSNWWLDILSFIPGLLIKVQLKQLWWNQTAKNVL